MTAQPTTPTIDDMIASLKKKLKAKPTPPVIPTTGIRTKSAVLGRSFTAPITLKEKVLNVFGKVGSTVLSPLNLPKQKQTLEVQQKTPSITQLVTNKRLFVNWIYSSSSTNVKYSNFEVGTGFIFVAAILAIGMVGAKLFNKSEKIEKYRKELIKRCNFPESLAKKIHILFIDDHMDSIKSGISKFSLKEYCGNTFIEKYILKFFSNDRYKGLLFKDNSDFIISSMALDREMTLISKNRKDFGESAPIPILLRDSFQNREIFKKHMYENSIRFFQYNHYLAQGEKVKEEIKKVVLDADVLRSGFISEKTKQELEYCKIKWNTDNIKKCIESVQKIDIWAVEFDTSHTQKDLKRFILSRRVTHLREIDTDSTSLENRWKDYEHYAGVQKVNLRSRITNNNIFLFLELFKYSKIYIPDIVMDELMGNNANHHNQLIDKCMNKLVEEHGFVRSQFKLLNNGRYIYDIVLRR